MTDPLTRYADELREEARRLTNELAKMHGGKMINDGTENCPWKCADDARDCICRNEYRATVQPALIAQYDAIVAAIPEWNAMVPLTSHAPDALRRAYADGWRDGWNAHRISTLNRIANHDPRKGAE